MTSRPRPRRAPARGDVGAASIEWVGAILICAVLVGLVVLSVAASGTTLGGRTAQAACRVLTVGQGGCTLPPAAEAGASDPASACSPAPGAAPSSLPVTRARLGLDDGRAWEKTLTSGGAYRVSLAGADPDAPGGPGRTGSQGSAITLDAGAEPVAAVRASNGGVELVAGPSWLETSTGAADALVADAMAGEAADATLASSPVRSLWDGVRRGLGSGTDTVSAPDATVVAAGAVLDAADAATGMSSYPGTSSASSTSPLGVRVSGDGQATVFLLTDAPATQADTVVALGVDSTGQPRRVGVSVLPGAQDDPAAAIADPRLAKTFGWDDGTADTSGTPRALSAAVSLDDGAPAGSLTAAADLLASAGSAQWAIGSETSDPLRTFTTAARDAGSDGSLTVRAGAVPSEQPPLSLASQPGGLPLAWDGVWRGGGDAVTFDGRSWTPKGPCG